MLYLRKELPLGFIGFVFYDKKLLSTASAIWLRHLRSPYRAREEPCVVLCA